MRSVFIFLLLTSAAYGQSKEDAEAQRYLQKMYEKTMPAPQGQPQAPQGQGNSYGQWPSSGSFADRYPTNSPLDTKAPTRR